MYISHRITKSGSIIVEEKIDGTIHGFSIAPNQPLEKYNEQIEADPDFAKYRTAENADAYIESITPSPEELAEQEQARQRGEKIRQLREEIRSSKPPQSNPELAKRVEKLEQILGLRELDD